MKTKSNIDTWSIYAARVFSVTTVVAILILSLAGNAAIAEEQKTADDCKEESEYSWNPSNQKTPPRLERFYSLEDLISSEYQKGNYPAATAFITEYLDLAAIYKNNWNFGNAIHDGYRYLGLISYKSGDMNKAAEYLIKSSESTGSPQLDTFGPEMDLANLLLKEGKTEEVVIYLKGIQKFWEMDNGVVDVWLKQIAQGEQPELSRFGDHRLTPIQRIMNWFLLLWPMAICLIVYTRKRRHLSPIKFLLSAIPVAYVVMFSSSYASFSLLSPILDVTPSSLLIYVIFAHTTIFQFIIPTAVVFLLSKIKALHIQPVIHTDTL